MLTWAFNQKFGHSHFSVGRKEMENVIQLVYPADPKGVRTFSRSQ